MKPSKVGDPLRAGPRFDATPPRRTPPQHAVMTAGTDLSAARPRHIRYGLRTPLPAPQEDQHLHRAGRPEPRHQGSRRRHLARRLHALQSRLLRPEAENLATPRQSVRHEVVTHVSGTWCYLCVRAGHSAGWRATADDDEHYVHAIAL